MGVQSINVGLEQSRNQRKSVERSGDRQHALPTWHYDVVNGGIVWNATNSDHAIPASMYLASKPSFWGANQPWPPYDPAKVTAAAIFTDEHPSGVPFSSLARFRRQAGRTTNAPVISLVSVSFTDKHFSTITWTTSEPATSIVKGRRYIAYGTSATNSSLVLLHS